MNTYLAIPFLSFCINLIAVVYGMVLRRRGTVYSRFTVYSILFAGWALTDLLLWLPVSANHVETVLRIQVPFYGFSGVGFLYIVYAYLHRRRDFLLVFFTAFSVIAVAIGMNSQLVVSDYVLLPWGYGMKPGPLHLPGATISALAPYLLGMYLLIQRAVTSRDPKEQTELGFYVFSIFFLVLIAFIAFIIVPEFFSISSQPLVHASIALFQVLNIYAIFRYQLFSIGIQSAANDLFSDASDGIIILGNNNRLVQANQRANEILSGGFPESLEVTVQTLLSEFPRGNRENSEVEVEVEFDNREIGYISLTLSPVVHNGEQTGKLLQVRDISEQKRAQQHILDINLELEKARDEALGASHAKSRFLANMSHELRTPLNAIIGYSEMLREQLESEGAEQHVTDIDRIHLAGNHLLSLINNVLDLSKIEAGKVEIHIDSFTVGGLARMVSAMAEPLIQKNGNAYCLDCPDTIGDMRSDVMKLRQCLINVLGNAARFTRDGTVELIVRRESDKDGDVVSFSVRDTGIGIKPEHLGRIFDTFSQADDNTTRAYGGSGLGLAISKRLITLLGGDITVTSNPGEGSCFTIRVPADYHPAERDSGQTEPG